MKRVAYIPAAALLALSLVTAACDDDETPGPRDAAPGDATPGDLRPDMPATGGDTSSETGGEVAGDARADGGTADGPLEALPLPDAATGEQVYVALLTGAEENPAVATTAMGSATFVLNAAKTALVYQLRHNVVNATMAHLHNAAAGENGPIAVAIAPLGAEISGTLALTPTQVTELEAGRLYANIHSTTFASGEIRGQLLRPGETVFVAVLTGAQEAPAVTTAAAGTASVILDATKTSVHYRVVTSGLTPTAAHFHRGMAKVAGPVAYALAPLAASIEGTQAVSAGDVAELESGLWYVNFHTAANTGGEIRGQVLTPGAKVLVGALSGGQEVPAVTTTTTGTGMVVLPYARNRIHYHLATTAMAPTAAHIHRAPGGVSGPVTFPITIGTGTMSMQSAITETQAQELERGLFYFNVHTAANASGEARGQIIGPDERLYTAVLSGANEIPMVTSTATGGVGFILNGAGTQLRYDGSFTMLTATAAHIHGGGPGVAAGPVVYPLNIVGTTLTGVTTVLPADLTLLDGGEYYANVHSAANPGGEIRGQIAKR